MLVGERGELPPQRREAARLELDEQVAAHEVDHVPAHFDFDDVPGLAVPLLELRMQRAFVERPDHTVVFCAEAVSSLRTAGATSVPKSSIDRMTCACGIVPTLICARKRSCRKSSCSNRIFSTTCSGLPTRSAPRGVRRASKLCRSIGGHPRSRPMRVIISA